VPDAGKGHGAKVADTHCWKANNLAHLCLLQVPFLLQSKLEEEGALYTKVCAPPCGKILES
jgi:hypothetical protein